MSKFFMFRGVDFELGYSDYTHSEGKTGISRMLNDKNRTVSIRDFSYRVINHWDSNKLISSRRGDDKGWRKYSIMDIVWLNVIKELREFGFSLMQIKQVKNVLSENKTKNSEFPILEYYISLALINKPVFLMVFPNGEAHPLTETEYQSNRNYNSENNHIHINLNKIVQQIFPAKNLKTTFRNDLEPSFDERKAIQLLRMNHFNEVSVQFPGGETSVVNSYKENQEDKVEEVINRITEKDYLALTIKHGINKELTLMK